MHTKRFWSGTGGPCQNIGVTGDVTGRVLCVFPEKNSMRWARGKVHKMYDRIKTKGPFVSDSIPNLTFPK